MAFYYEPIPEESFQTLEDVYRSAEKEKESLARIPIKGLLEHGARFIDDEYFGDETQAYQFNQKGIRSLCSFLGIRLDTLELLERQNLATEVLNDLLVQRAADERLKTQELIIDESANVIIGVVSESYISYSNHHFLKDIEKLLQLEKHQHSLFKDDSNFIFKGAYSVNTQMSLRFTIKKKVGVVRGHGGTGKDVTELGFQLKNSMIGDSSININFFLYRMICANGLIVPVGFAVNRYFHSGNIDNFYERLENAFNEITKRIGKAGQLIEDLGALNYSSQLLAELNLSEMIFNIIPGSKRQIVDAYKIANTPRGDSKEKNRILRDAEIIGHIPDVFGREDSKKVFTSKWRDNATMFDFINIFTEYAKELSIAQKIEVEEKAGYLADWIAKNKRKFH